MAQKPFENSSRDFEPSNESQFQQWVIRRAIECGWLVYHTPAVPIAPTKRPTKRYFTPTQGHKGFPDLVLCHRETGIVVFAELKTNRGAIKPHQRTWHEALRRHPQNQFYLWRPKDKEHIERILESKGLDTHGIDEV